MGLASVSTLISGFAGKCHPRMAQWRIPGAAPGETPGRSLCCGLPDESGRRLFYQSEFTTVPECCAVASPFWIHAMNAWKSSQFDMACCQWSAIPAALS